MKSISKSAAEKSKRV